MLIKVKPESKRVVNLINAVRQVGAILPGDRIEMVGEKPATSRSGFQPVSTGLAT